jgi:hypothetical protein
LSKPTKERWHDLKPKQRKRRRRRRFVRHKNCCPQWKKRRCGFNPAPFFASNGPKLLFV